MEGQIFLKGPVKRPIEEAFCIRFNNGHVKVREESWNEMPFFRIVVSFSLLTFGCALLGKATLGSI